MRISLYPPVDLDPEQRALYDQIQTGIAADFTAFKTVNTEGALIGPFAVSVRFPTVGKHSWALTLAINALADLPPRCKEVAVLVAAGFYRAAYQINAHTAVAEHLGIPLPQISAIVANIKPPDLAPDEAVAFDVACALCRGGLLAEPTWRLAVATFGERAAAQLVYVVAIYAFVAVTLNAFDISVPA